MEMVRCEEGKEVSGREIQLELLKANQKSNKSVCIEINLKVSAKLDQIRTHVGV